MFRFTLFKGQHVVHCHICSSDISSAHMHIYSFIHSFSPHHLPLVKHRALDTWPVSSVWAVGGQVSRAAYKPEQILQERTRWCENTRPHPRSRSSSHLDCEARLRRAAQSLTGFTCCLGLSIYRLSDVLPSGIILHTLTRGFNIFRSSVVMTSTMCIEIKGLWSW